MVESWIRSASMARTAHGLHSFLPDERGTEFPEGLRLHHLVSFPDQREFQRLERGEDSSDKDNDDDDGGGDE